MTAGTVPDGGSRGSESVEVISVVEVEMLKVVVHVVSCWEGDGIGWDDVAGRLDVGLDAVRVDLGVIGVVHSNDLVSDEVGTICQHARYRESRGLTQTRSRLGYGKSKPWFERWFRMQTPCRPSQPRRS